MPHLFETAPTGRAKCRGCGSLVAKGELRFGERLPNPFDDKGGDMTQWYHLICAAYRRPEPLLETMATVTEPVENRDALIAEANLGVTHRRLPRISTAERAPTGRATCRACKELIEKGAWRIALVFYEDGRFTPSGYIHTKCVAPHIETTAIRTRLKHFSPALTDADLDAIESELTT